MINELLLCPSCDSQLENERYGPYVSLCNQALQDLAVLGENLPFRHRSTLDIRFVRSDPKVIKSSYKDGESVDRKPDVGTTSLQAARRVAKNSTESSFALAPKRAFTWSELLMSTEFKLKVKNLSGKFNERGGFSVTRGQTIDQDYFNSVPSPDPADGFQQEASKKRTLEENTESERPAKMRIANRTKIPSVHSQPTESQSKNALSARVQCASYGLEMLSHCLGVHHAINLLFIGMSFLVA